MPFDVTRPLVLKSYIPSALGIKVVTITMTAPVFPCGLLFKGLSRPKILKQSIQALFKNLSLSLPTMALTITISTEATFPLSPGFAQPLTDRDMPFLLLPVAIGFFITLDLLPRSISQEYALCGLLDEQGSLLFTPGILPVALLCSEKNLGLICPDVNGTEALWANTSPLAMADLRSFCEHFHDVPLPNPSLGSLVTPFPLSPASISPGISPASLDLCKIALQKGKPLLFQNFSVSAKEFLLTRVLEALSPLLSGHALLSLNCALSLKGQLTTGHLMGFAQPISWPEKSYLLFPELGMPPFITILTNPFGWREEEVDSFVSHRRLIKQTGSLAPSWIIFSDGEASSRKVHKGNIIRLFQDEGGEFMDY